MKSVIRIFASLLLLASALPAKAQVDVKTNLLYDATLTVNLGAEVALAPKWSFDLSGNYNGWTLDNGRRWKHWLVQPEARYWFCDRFSGHFVGFHLLGGQYNLGAWKHGFDFLGNNFSNLRDRRYQGWYAGAGVAYGYTWILAKHWSVEAEIGLGWAYTRYDVFPCQKCGTKLAKNRVHNYVGPTKAAINLIYVF
ncbi:MAG: DUF3575 domain-containing protein [Duncaniella sp.]|nr:DUF3575 domain-containing protein [Duncaniella sp.]